MSMWTPADARVKPRIWLDPADTSAIDLDPDNKLIEIQNKGTLNIRVEQPDPIPRPAWVANGIGGLPALNTAPNNGAWMKFEPIGGESLMQIEGEELFLIADTTAHAGFNRFAVAMARVPLNNDHSASTPAFYLSGMGGINYAGGGEPFVYGANTGITVRDTSTCERVKVYRPALHRQKYWRSNEDGLAANTEVDGRRDWSREDNSQALQYPFRLGAWWGVYGQGSYGLLNWEDQNPRALFGELLLYPPGLLPWEVEANEGYLAHKWGTAHRLPSSHGFNNAPPIKSEGNARKAVPLSAVDLVAVRDYDTKESLGYTVPLPSGDWTHPIPAGRRYDLTYYAEGCAPVVHGPYQAPDP